jgi:peptidoglycan/xylan/chitin deacetylase (PgdA/CDA1 family)
MKTVSLLFHDVYEADPRESGFASEAADRYKLSVREFDAQLSGLKDVAPGRVAMTVDDGGVSYYTQVADRLEAHGWRGHCFVSTDFIGARGFLDARQLRELDARGHVIGSHSASHPSRISACTPDAIRREWAGSRRILEDLLGHEVSVGSVPGGYHSRQVARAAREAGLRVLFTSQPTRTVGEEQGCTVIGRFTIRRGDPLDLARRLVLPSPWARRAAWASWNAKGLVKPLLGQSYGRVADWVLAGRTCTRDHA